MTDLAFRTQLQAEVEGLRLGKSPPKAEREVRPGELREEALFKARQELSLIVKQKTDLEAEYQGLKDQIGEIRRARSVLQETLAGLRQEVRKVVAEIRSEPCVRGDFKVPEPRLKEFEQIQKNHPPDQYRHSSNDTCIRTARLS
jgi:predicted nuclease with TOPRIM domain